MDAPEKEWRREDGAHKKVHLRTVENPRWQSEPRSVLIFLFSVGDIDRFGLRKDAVDVVFGIDHKLIRPRTPEHNGKVKRSHRIDQERFYRTLSFSSLGDLREEGARWMKRYNSTPRMALGPKTPDQVEFAKLGELMLTTGEVRCPKLGRRLTSSGS